MNRNEYVTAINATHESIMKWVDIVCRVGEDKGPFNCALCKEYNLHEDPPCQRCPVVIHGGSPEFCKDTPYAEWDKHKADEHPLNVRRLCRCETCEKLAKNMVDFLEGIWNKLVYEFYMEEYIR